ncbi:MAG: HAD family phosphatase [Candidatus Saliniplasma sp.]
MEKTRYELVIFDMDGVLVDVHSSWAWVHEHFDVDNNHSLKAYLNGEIDDLEFIRRDIGLWKGKKKDITKGDIEEILKDTPLMPGYEDCLACFKRHDFKTAIISGGLKPLARIIGDSYFDVIKANDVDSKEDKLTGEGILEVPLNDKGTAFDEVIKEFDTTPERTVAVGNSFIDAPMLERAGLGIAFDPADEKVRYAADVIITEKDLSKVWETVKTV